MCGTPNYIAPEILESKRGHSYEADIWSLGVITFALLFGRPPFETNEVKTTYEKIKICEYSFPAGRSVSHEAKDFIRMMLRLHPSDRATLNELVRSPFMCKVKIPVMMPRFTLACPPDESTLEMHQVETG